MSYFIFNTFLLHSSPGVNTVNGLGVHTPTASPADDPRMQQQPHGGGKRPRVSSPSTFTTEDYLQVNSTFFLVLSPLFLLAVPSSPSQLIFTGVELELLKVQSSNLRGFDIIATSFKFTKSTSFKTFTLTKSKISCPHPFSLFGVKRLRSNNFNPYRE